MEQFQTAAPMLRRRVALAGVAMLAAIVLASCVVAWSSSRTVLESGLAMAPTGMKVDWQALMYANPGMTPAEAKMQAQLMEEGSITIDPNSENAAADFYKNSESSDIGDNDEVEDAGPGNHLGGWTHPELLEPPSPEEVQSFVDPANNLVAPVLNPVDYARNPGAAFSMTSARKNIKLIQAELTKTHEEAEAAKATYEAEEAKSAKLKQEFAAMARAAQNAGSHNWSPDQDTAVRSSGNLMWSQSAKPPEHKNNAADPEHWKVDTDKMEDPAAEFRKQFYNKQRQEQAFLAKQMEQYRLMGGQQAGRAEQGMSPVMQQSGMMYQQPEAMQQQQQQQAPAAMHTFEGQQLRMLDTPAASAEQEGAAAMASYDNRYSRIASEAYGLRQQREEEKLRSDTARLELARARLAAASRRQKVFDGAEFKEGCPEGTPGCRSRYSRGNRGRVAQNSLSQQEVALRQEERRQETDMARFGDKMIPLHEAREQTPKFLGDALYE